MIFNFIATRLALICFALGRILMRVAASPLSNNGSKPLHPVTTLRVSLGR